MMVDFGLSFQLRYPLLLCCPIFNISGLYGLIQCQINIEKLVDGIVIEKPNCNNCNTCTIGGLQNCDTRMTKLKL